MANDGALRQLRAGCTLHHSGGVWMLPTLRSLRQTADAKSDGCTRRVQHGPQPREILGHTHDELRPLLRLCATRTEP
jgi:hypothetical protein